MSSHPAFEDPILMFVNVNSGGGHGRKLIKLCSGVDNIYVVELPSEAETFYDSFYDIITHPRLKCIACGGDGTVSWVMQILKDLYLSADYMPPMAIIPLGTGNDMCRSLEWGTGFSKGQLNKVFDKIEKIVKSKNIKEIDTWNLTVTDNVTGGAREFKMLNYFSFGVDANVTYEYASMRAEKKPATRLGSFALYIPAGAKSLGDKTKLVDFSTIKLYGKNNNPIEEETILKPKSDEQTITFLNAKRMYAGRILWRGKQKASMNDGKLEVLINKGAWKLAMTNIGAAFPRSVTQTKSVVVETSCGCCFQVDGEAMKADHKSTFKLEKIGTYPFIFPEEKCKTKADHKA